jgi:hypothetical protein
MSFPRQVIAGSYYLITRRCTQRQFLLRPDKYLGMVEAVGVEPTSEDASERISTCVGTLFEVSPLPAAAGLQGQQAD